MRKLLTLIVGVLIGVLALGLAFGVTTARATAVTTTASSPYAAPVSDHPCDPQQYYMQCASGASGQFSTSPLRQGFSPQFGIDFAWGGPSGLVARSFGAHFGISYLSNTTKDWNYSTLHSYANAGLGVGFVWETAQYRPLAGCSGGTYDAQRANAEVGRYGYPSAPVFFAVDFDTYNYSSYGVVGQYLRCAKNTLGNNRAGVYGGLHTMEIAAANGIPANRRWQTLAWSYGRWVNACLRQYSINQFWHGYSADYNLAVCQDWGQANGTPSPAPDPYRGYSKTNRHFSGGIVASEYNAIKTWDKFKCNATKPDHRVCAVTKRDLKLLAGRVYFLAHHRMVRGHWVSRSQARWDLPNKTQPYGSRYAGMTHRINAHAKS